MCITVSTFACEVTLRVKGSSQDLELRDLDIWLCLFLVTLNHFHMYTMGTVIIQMMVKIK